MLEKSTVVKGLMSKEWEWSSITERSTELIPKLVGQNGISVSTMVISEMEKKKSCGVHSGKQNDLLTIHKEGTERVFGAVLSSRLSQRERKTPHLLSAAQAVLLKEGSHPLSG